MVNEVSSPEAQAQETCLNFHTEEQGLSSEGSPSDAAPCSSASDVPEIPQGELPPASESADLRVEAQDSMLAKEEVVLAPPSAEEDASESQALRSLRLRFKNPTPLRQKTLEYLRDDPELDGATADRLAREALGFAADDARDVEKPAAPSLRKPTTFVPAPGSFGTSDGQTLIHGALFRERLASLPWVDRKEAILAVLTEAARKSRHA